MEYSDYIETRTAAGPITGTERFAFSQGGLSRETDLDTLAAHVIADVVDSITGDGVDNTDPQNPVITINPYTYPFPQFTTATSTTAYTGTTAPAIVAYATGQKFQVKAHATSTGSATLDLNTIGAKKWFKSPTVQAGSGDIVINQIYLIVYDAALDAAAGGFLMIGSGGAIPVKATAAELIANTDDAKFATALALKGKLAANDTETGDFSVAQTDDQITIFVDSATAVVATFPVLTANTYVTLVNIGAGDVSWVASGTNFEGAVASLPGGVVGAAVFFYKTTTDIKVISPPTVESISVLTHDTTQTGNVTTGVDVLQTYALPANQLANNGNSITGSASGTFAATANNKEVNLNFGATTILDTAPLVTSIAGSWLLRYEIIRTGAATQKCNAFIIFSDPAIAPISSYITAAETLSNSINIVITGEATATNDIVKETFKAVFEP